MHTEEKIKMMIAMINMMKMIVIFLIMMTKISKKKTYNYHELKMLMPDDPLQ